MQYATKTKGKIYRVVTEQAASQPEASDKYLSAVNSGAVTVKSERDSERHWTIVSYYPIY